jgi:YgiT-type zinc finger domain-containing protein
MLRPYGLTRICPNGIFLSMQNETSRREENLVEQRVTYTLEVSGKLFVVENVPARVDQETGEQFFSPETVERLQEIIHGQEKPVRVVETPVFDYAA